MWVNPIVICLSSSEISYSKMCYSYLATEWVGKGLFSN